MSTKESIETSHVSTAAETVTTSRRQMLIAKATRGVQLCRSLMKESPLTVIGLNAKQTSKISDILEQSKILCEVNYNSYLIMCHLHSIMQFHKHIYVCLCLSVHQLLLV